MSLNYKRELEDAAKSMILVHDPQVLIKMIVRRIVQKVKVRHAAILLHDMDKDTYVLTVSRGERGLRIPQGFARMDTDNPLIRFFRERMDKKVFSNGQLLYDKAKRALRKRRLETNVKKLLEKSLYQMEIFQAIACIPSYFRNELVGMLLLGRKKNKKALRQEELDFFSALASDVAMAIRNARLFRELEIELEHKHRLFLHTTIALAQAIDAKDHYTHGHTTRVTELSLKIAHQLIQKDTNINGEKFLENLHIASLLHDIGKIGIPESILNKDGPLNDDEREHIEKHPIVGEAILQPIKELKEAIQGVKYHHEKFDGSGYPEGLKGAQIPLIASIISVADCFDAMTTDRPYRKGLSKEEAIQDIQRGGGTQFDPKIAEAFAEAYQEGKI